VAFDVQLPATREALKAQLSSVTDEHSMHLTASAADVASISTVSSRNPDVSGRIIVVSSLYTATAHNQLQIYAPKFGTVDQEVI